MENEEMLRRKVLDKAWELLEGRSNDGVKLAFLGDGERDELDELDLSALAGLHRAANGGVELRFTDRIRLIELLLEATSGEAERKAENAAGLLGALNHAAGKVGGGEVVSGGDT